MGSWDLGRRLGMGEVEITQELSYGMGSMVLPTVFLLGGVLGAAVVWVVEWIGRGHNDI